MRKIENPSKATLTARIWLDKHKHPCMDCGKLCSFTALRCRPCNSKILMLPRKRNYICIDCGLSVSDKLSKRCRQCAGQFQRGSEHPNWKGGRRNKDGYIYVLKPGYPRADNNGYVAEHIFIWETYYNKPLPKGWEVHHYNGIKNDNRPRNLFAKSKKQHRLIIPELQKKIQELEALLINQGQLC